MIATDLARATPPGTGVWRARFDAAADDIRAALGWAADRPEHRANAHDLAIALAELTFTRNLVGESQQRYEQAAALADDPVAVRSALRHAAAVAGCRLHGDDMYRLHRAAADAARRAGDPAGTARDLATAAAIAYRFSGTFSQPPPPGEAATLLAEARELAGDDPPPGPRWRWPRRGAAPTPSEPDPGEPEAVVPQAIALAERAVDLAARTGDPLALSAALDALTGAQCWAGDTFATAQTTRRRVELLASAPVTPASAHELVNALVRGGRDLPRRG